MKWLDEKGFEYEYVDLVKDTPSFETLKDMYQRSNLEIKRFFNTSGVVYREQKLKDRLPSLTDDEAIELLAGEGKLIKRPIVDSGEYVFPGFKEKEWELLVK